MKLILCQLATTKSGAAIELIIVLLIAGAIAFLTSYFYYRSVYMKKISALEKEKKSLESRISDQTNEISGLKTRISGLEK